MLLLLTRCARMPKMDEDGMLKPMGSGCFPKSILAPAVAKAR